MKLDELALANQQLADMLKSGMPLEGALREVCQDIANGKLKAEFAALEKELSSGRPFAEAVNRRALPDLYRHTLIAGAKSNQLPIVLNTLADHYASAHASWERLRSVMVYPTLVLIAATTASLLSSIFLTNMLDALHPEIHMFTYDEEAARDRFLFFAWVPSIVLALAVLIVFVALQTPGIRRNVEWSLPAFKEHRLSAFASSMSVLIKGGVPMAEALSLLKEAAPKDPLAREIAIWNSLLSAGETGFEKAAASSKLIPPLFRWAVTSAGDNLAAGFAKAAQIFERRANYKSELMLNTVLPILVVVLGAVIVLQTTPLFRSIITTMDRLGS